MCDSAWFWLGLVVCAAASSAAQAAEARDMSRAELLDRIRGGWAGQMIGNVLGLPFEFK